MQPESFLDAFVQLLDRPGVFLVPLLFYSRFFLRRRSNQALKSRNLRRMFFGRHTLLCRLHYPHLSYPTDEDTTELRTCPSVRDNFPDALQLPLPPSILHPELQVYADCTSARPCQHLRERA